MLSSSSQRVSAERIEELKVLLTTPFPPEAKCMGKGNFDFRVLTIYNIQHGLIGVNTHQP